MFTMLLEGNCLAKKKQHELESKLKILEKSFS